jgi:hypothetical protein
MRKIRKKVNKAPHKANVNENIFFDSKANMLRIGIAAVVVVLLIAVFMFMESGDGQLTIKNNSNLKLEYVQAYFVNAEGPMSEGIEFKDMASKQSESVPSGENYLLGEEANLEVKFKFENYEEVFVDAGYFNDNLKGDINVEFKQTDNAEVVQIKVKAANGLLPSTLIDCDELFTVNLKDGYVEE